MIINQEDLNIQPFAGVITKAAHSPQLFKEPEWCSSQGVNPQHSIQKSGALETELTGWRYESQNFRAQTFNIHAK